MAALLVAEEPRRVGQAHPCQRVSLLWSCGVPRLIACSSIRFAPPLVIEEEDLKKAVKIIGECLADLDVVSLCSPQSCVHH
jgi:4-aminobutyrate aminotransferase-like enzyme